MRNPRDGVTVAEVARVAGRLERRPVTVGTVRSILVLDTRGRALMPQRHGETRVYAAEDVALVRLALRLRAAGVSPTVARVVVACLRNQLVAAWHGQDDSALAVIGLRGEIRSRLSARPAGVVAWIALRDVWQGLESAIRRVRQAQPEIWQWKAQPVTAFLGAGGWRSPRTAGAALRR